MMVIFCGGVDFAGGFGLIFLGISPSFVGRSREFITESRVLVDSRICFLLHVVDVEP